MCRDVRNCKQEDSEAGGGQVLQAPSMRREISARAQRSQAFPRLEHLDSEPRQRWLRNNGDLTATNSGVTEQK